jgi:hypothetical protein
MQWGGRFTGWGDVKSKGHRLRMFHVNPSQNTRFVVSTLDHPNVSRESGLASCRATTCHAL